MIDFEQLGRELDAEMGILVEEPINQNGPEQECDENGNPVESNPLPPILDSVDFSVEDIPEPPQIVQGLIHQGTKVMVGGGSKSFKTWIQLDLAYSVAYGIPWMDIPTVQGRVLFVNMEIQKFFMKKRMAIITKARGIQELHQHLDIWNLRGKNAPYRIILPQIIERIKTTPYALLDLDPIYKLYGNTDENSASDVAALMNELERVTTQTQSCVTFGAHYSKGNQSTKEAIDRVSGSGAFGRDPDSIINFTPHEENGSFVVEPILRNMPPMEPFVVTWNFPLMERNPDLDPSKLKKPGGRPAGASKDDILDLLPEGGLSNSEWQKRAVKTLEISESTFYRLKRELKSDDRILFSRINELWKPLIKQ